MKALGVARRIDSLGRVSIPAEVCKSLGIVKAEWGGNSGTKLDIYQQDDGIVIEIAGDKSKGMLRSVDTLGRLVIPIELAKKLDIDRNRRDSVEFFIDGKSLVIRKYQPGCVFCGEIRDVKEYMGKNICSECMKLIKSAN